MAKSEPVAPNQTVYLSNLNEKLKKEELRVALYSLYSQFGAILDINVMKTAKMRGQAFVVFDNLTAASEALRQTQGFIFYNRPIRVAYAKSKSDVVAKRDGSYTATPRLHGHKRAQPTADPAALSAAADATRTKRPRSQPSLDVDPRSLAPDEFGLTGVPAGTTELALALILKQFPGFASIRLLPSGAPTELQAAVARFDSSQTARQAASGLQQFEILPGHLLSVVQPIN